MLLIARHKPSQIVHPWVEHFGDSLLLLLDAGSLYQATGDTLPYWADLTGNGNTATQLASAKRPTFLANAHNGRPAVDLGDAPRGMVTPLNIVRPFTIIHIEKPNTTTDQARTVQATDLNSEISVNRQTYPCYLDGDGTTNPNSPSNVSDWYAGDTGIHFSELSVPLLGEGFAEWFVDGVDRTYYQVNKDFGTLALGAAGRYNEHGKTKLFLVAVLNRRPTQADRVFMYGDTNTRFNLSLSVPDVFVPFWIYNETDGRKAGPMLKNGFVNGKVNYQTNYPEFNKYQGGMGGDANSWAVAIGSSVIAFAPNTGGVTDPFTITNWEEPFTGRPLTISFPTIEPPVTNPDPEDY